MSDPEQRRRRKSQPPPSSAGGTGGGPLPMAALIIGVIVAGLGIGALVSAFQNRASLPELGATSVPAVTPVPEPSAPAPLGSLPPTPSPTPLPSPTGTPAASPSAAPSAKPSAAPTASAVATASAAAGATAAPTASPPPPKPIVVVTYAAAAPSARPSPVASIRPAVPPNPGDAATAVVRRYLDDLIGGDEAGAYAALGGTSSDRSLDLKEEAFLDKDARITSIHVSSTDATGTTVDAEVTSGRGSYAATFHVINGPNGTTTINHHDYIKI